MADSKCRELVDYFFGDTITDATKVTIADEILELIESRMREAEKTDEATREVSP